MVQQVVMMDMLRQINKLPVTAEVRKVTDDLILPRSIGAIGASWMIQKSRLE